MSRQNRDLARLARATAQESPEPGRKTWLVVATALDQAATPAEARAAIEDIALQAPLRIIAAACLRSICPEDSLTSTEPQLTAGSHP